MRVLGLLAGFALLFGCGEIREVPASEDASTEAAASESEGDGDTTTSGAEASTTQPDMEDVDRESTGEPDSDRTTDTGVEPELEWSTFCAANVQSSGPGEEIVLDIPVTDTVWSEVTIGVRVGGTDAGLRISVGLNDQEAVLMDEQSCLPDVSAIFTDLGDFGSAAACDAKIPEPDRFLIPVDSLESLVSEGIEGTWQLRVQSEGARTLQMINEVCVQVGNPQ